MPTAGALSLIGLWTGLAGTGLIVSLFGTNPGAIGPYGVTFWFIILLTVLSGILTLVLYVVKTALHLHSTSRQRLRYSGRQGLLIGGGVTALIALGSLRQFNLRDALLLSLILLVIELYLRLKRP
jgi:hypothetical protein